MNSTSLLVLTLVAVAILALAGAWPPAAEVLNPLLCVTVLAALPGRALPAMLVGLATGFIVDAWTTLWFGQHAFTHMWVGYVLAFIAARMDMVQAGPAALALALGTAAELGLGVGLRALFDKPVDTTPGPWIWVAAVAANTALGLVFLRFASRRGGLAWQR
ncbi:MAG: hypothetical protein KBD01_14065 [Acidobacteria bacterium]|nr:hypothetical protein [Acidobacteriota bacterium]